MSNQATSLLIINQAANGNFGLSVHGTKVVLAPSDSRDPYQQWVKKETSIKDRDGQPAFVLVNKGSNEAIKPDTPIAPMSLVPYDPVASPNDTSIHWTESVNADQGFRYI
ncbi:Stress responsive protein [Rhynchospora pubera]|uniref:Stress responsive protein n=1 Tax=Rhynchospora pubera TaxID=906938 RepID=A0AAV8FKI1_9POAL|nr:Stress responsive protein [Rhynchospora pubera]